MKEKPHWPGWFFGPNGEAQIFQSEDGVPKGWTSNQSEALAENRAHGFEPPVSDEPETPAKPKRGRPRK
jgi:hypothetical protein